jgi:hypothetical protein
MAGARSDRFTTTRDQIFRQRELRTGKVRRCGYFTKVTLTLFETFQ